MKKAIKLLTLSFLTLPFLSSVGIKINPYKEDALDLLAHSHSLKAEEISTDEESVVYPTYAQYGESENGKKYLRFLTPFKASLLDGLELTYTRTFNTNVKTLSVKSVYEGVKNGDAISYWSGTDWTSNVNEREENAYIATYTIEFNPETEGFIEESYGYEITASLTLKEGSKELTSSAKTTSINKAYKHDGKAIYFKSNTLANSEEWYGEGLSTSAKFFDENMKKLGSTSYGINGIALKNPGHFNGTQYWSFTVPSKAKYVQFYKIEDSNYQPKYEGSKSSVMPLMINADLYEVDSTQETLLEGSTNYEVKLLTSKIDIEAIKREEVKVTVSLSDSEAATYTLDKSLIMKDDEVTVSLKIVDGYKVSSILVNGKALDTTGTVFTFKATKSSNVVYVTFDEEEASISEEAYGDYTEEHESFSLKVEEGKAIITYFSYSGDYVIDLTYRGNYKHTSEGVKFEYTNDKGERAEVSFIEKNSKITGAIVSNVKALGGSFLKSSYNMTKVIHMTSITDVQVSSLSKNEYEYYEAVVGKNAYIYIDEINYLPKDANSHEFEFVSYDEDVISVSYESGDKYATLTFSKPSDEACVEVRDATNPKVSYLLTFTVLDLVYPSGIKISSTGGKTEIEQGETLDLSATFINASSVTSANNTVKWTVANENPSDFEGKALATIKANSSDSKKATLTSKSDEGATGNVIVTASVAGENGTKVSSTLVITIKKVSLEDKEYAPLIGTWKGCDSNTGDFSFEIKNDGTGVIYACYEYYSICYDRKNGDSYIFLDDNGVEFAFTLSDENNAEITYDPDSDYCYNVFFDETLSVRRAN